MKAFNKILISIFIILSFNINIFALEKNNIKEFMTNKINTITVILQEKNKSIDDKAKKIFTMLDGIFDYKLMSKISLGRKYKGLSSQEKLDFSSAFQNKLKKSYIDKLNLYTDQITKVKEIKQTKKNRIILYTDLIGEESTFSIDYKFYKNKKNQWYIYDVKILGVSILQTYRKQFKEYLQNHSINDLIHNM